MSNPTPLRELLHMLECGDLSPAEQMQLAEALSARDEAGACQHERSYGAPWRCAKCGYRMDDATPPASGEAGAELSDGEVDALAVSAGLVWRNSKHRVSCNADHDRLMAFARMLTRRLAAVAPAGMDGAVALIATERQRQVSVEGWTPDHDDRHDRDELAAAAACYAAPARVFVAKEGVGRDYEPYTFYRDLWPWAGHWWKPKDRVRDLVRAGALIVAEIERLQRAAAPTPPATAGQEDTNGNA